MRICTFLTGCVLAASLLALPAAAHGQTLVPPLSLAGSGGDTGSSEPWGATLAFHLGLGGSFETDGHGADASPTLGVTPVIERRFGPNFALGAEWMFLWVRASDYDGARSKIWAPHLRARISFPVYDKVEVGAMLALGMGIILPDKGDTDYAFPSYRFAFGGSYRFAPTVRAFADLGYLSMSYSTDVTVAGQTKSYDSTFHTVLLTDGLMAVF